MSARFSTLPVRRIEADPLGERRADEAARSRAERGPEPTRKGDQQVPLARADEAARSRAERGPEPSRKGDQQVPPAAQAWPATVPAVAQLLREGLDLGPATVFVGENGTGKSTLVEAIAMTYGLNAEGGSTGARHRSFQSEAGLDGVLRCVRGAGASKWGFFLRAETMHGFFTWQVQNQGEDFHAMSHGEAFRELLATSRFRGPGLYVLDEPESALSFTAELALLGQLHDLAATGTAQVVMATHSPVLAALPDATLYELGDWGLARRAWRDLDLVDHHRRFLEAPERYLRHLC